MRVILVSILVAGGCASGPRSGPSAAAGSAATAPAMAAAPVAAAAPATPAAVDDDDAREVSSVSVALGFHTGDRDVWRDTHDHDGAARVCFERGFPRASRAPFDTIYARVIVPNADAGEETPFFVPIQTGVMYPEPGTYPAYEACLRDAIGKARAPADVGEVEVFVHVQSRAVKGLLGHGGG